MRTLIRLILIVCTLLFLLGLGLYIPYRDEAHEWVRQLGRKPLAPGEVLLRQRTSADLPGLDGAVKVRVGDIKRGKTADVTILGPEAITLASKASAQVGDRIAFVHNGNKYEVEVVRYVDKIGPGDTATFRITLVDKEGPPAADVKAAEPSTERR